MYKILIVAKRPDGGVTSQIASFDAQEQADKAFDKVIEADFGDTRVYVTKLY